MKSILYLLGLFCTIQSHAQLAEQDREWIDLKNKLGGTTIVGLGESGHGFESYNRSKASLSVLLKKELHFRVVVFESSFSLSVISFLENDKESRLQKFLYPFWNTPSVKDALMKFIVDEQLLAKPLVLGFDLQEDCRYNRMSAYLIKEGIVKINRDKLNESDSILSYYIGRNYTRKGPINEEEYKTLHHNYSQIEMELDEYLPGSVIQKLLKRSVENRKWLINYLAIASTRERMFYRDSIMAENIDWLKTHVYQSDKIILWSANLHIDKATSKHTKWMGEYLSLKFPLTYFAIGFKKGDNDQVFTRNERLKEVNKLPANFDAMIYLKDLKKISPSEWKTPCE